MLETFWTTKRTETVSKTSLTLFQAFLIALILGDVLGKIESTLIKALFISATMLFLIIGLICADSTENPKKEL